MSAGAGDAKRVGAVVLAAGLSRRMGRPKLVLPWGERTVVEQVVTTLLKGGISEVVVVTGGARAEVKTALAGYPIGLAHNPDFARSEMVISLQVGIRSLSADCSALLVALGDQPTIKAELVQRIVTAYETSQARLIIPSYQKRRGHPWLVERSLWPGLLGLTEDQTLRDFLRANEAEIRYLETDSPEILKDLDTPEDYQRLRGEAL